MNKIEDEIFEIKILECKMKTIPHTDVHEKIKLSATIRDKVNHVNNRIEEIKKEISTPEDYIDEYVELTSKETDDIMLNLQILQADINTLNELSVEEQVIRLKILKDLRNTLAKHVKQINEKTQQLVLC